MSIFKVYKKGRYCPEISIPQITNNKMFFDMGKTTKLNPVRQAGGVKNHITY